MTLDIMDPISYGQIIRWLRKAVRPILHRHFFGHAADARLVASLQRRDPGDGRLFGAARARRQLGPRSEAAPGAAIARSTRGSCPLPASLCSWGGGLVADQEQQSRRCHPRDAVRSSPPARFLLLPGRAEKGIDWADLL
jgi:hypothetical protein